MQELNNQRKYYFNENVFQNIDNKEKAYWLGFMYADGYLLSNGYGFGITLKQSDYLHLVNFANFLQLNALDCIKENKQTNSCRIQLFDKDTQSDLIKIGFNSNKSYDNNCTVWNNIPNQYKKFFILGFWDGDGYVSITGEGKNQTGCVSNNDELLKAFVEYINLNLGGNFTKVLYSDGYPRIRIYTNKATIFLKWLYQDYDIDKVLKRKYNTFKNFKEPFYEKFKYRYLRKLPSGRFFIQSPTINKKKHTIGTFDTVREAIEAFNIDAEKYGYKKQEYKGEDF